VLQCVAVCCNVLQCVAVRCNVLQCVAMCCSVLQCVAVWVHDVFIRVAFIHVRVAVCCSVLQCVAVCSSVIRTCGIHTCQVSHVWMSHALTVHSHSYMNARHLYVCGTWRLWVCAVLCVAVCCSVLQCMVRGGCECVLQCVAVCCIVWYVEAVTAGCECMIYSYTLHIHSYMWKSHVWMSHALTAHSHSYMSQNFSICVHAGGELVVYSFDLFLWFIRFHFGWRWISASFEWIKRMVNEDSTKVD